MHRRPLPALAASVALVATPLSADDAPSLWDLITVEQIAQRFLQMGVMAVRTQVDLKYSDIVVNPLAGQVSMTDLQIWPLPDWDDDGDCLIEVNRAVISSAAVDEPERIRLKVQLSGVSADQSCLPPEPRQMLSMTGLEELYAPSFTFDIDYDISSAAAGVHAYGIIADMAAIDLTADFDYFWFDGRDDFEEPFPVAFLSSAALSVENLGLWDVVRTQLPPPFVNPESAGPFVSAAVGQVIAEANRDAAGPDAEGDPSQLNDAQRAFIDSVGPAWSAFLADPNRLVLATGIDPDDSVFVDFEYYEENPQAAFEDLQPLLGQATVAARYILPAGLLAQALGDGAGDLTADELLLVGRALVSGEGAPRNRARGGALLAELARDGDGEAALALAELVSDPAEAYGWALRAGRAEVPGATARLDRLEAEIGLAQVLELQKSAMGAVSHPLSALETLAGIRTEAALSLSGNGRLRSYETAAMWAMIGRAAGDAEASLILDEIDQKVRLSGSSGRQAWAEPEARAGSLAMEVWLGQDLPGRFAAE